MIDYCQRENYPLIISADCNAHNVAWGSTNTNKRGEALMNYIYTTNLIIANFGKNPTFETKTRKEVLDITLFSHTLCTLIRNWKVSNEETFSDHKYLQFELDMEKTQKWEYRNPRRTDWKKYNETLTKEFTQIKMKIEETTLSIEGNINKITKEMCKAFRKTCPISRNKTDKNKPWWTKELQELRQKARRAIRKAFKTKTEEDHQTAKQLRNDYKAKLKREKRDAWMDMCSNLQGLEPWAKLNKVLKATTRHEIGMLKKNDGTITETPEETLEILADTYFPHTTSDLKLQVENENFEELNKYINRESLRNAINQFIPYKAAGIDGIYPKMLQNLPEKAIALLIKLLRGCIKQNYHPISWRTGKVIFLSKPNKESYEEAKAYRPICLNSFLLKTLERLVKNYLDERITERKPFKSYQLAYQKGLSTELAIHNVVTKVEEALNKKNTQLEFSLTLKELLIMSDMTPL